MDRQQIAATARQMKTPEDLLNLLNQIKQDELTEEGFADFFHPFTIKHINYYRNPNHSFHRYRQFQIKKKTGGFRQITAPRNRSFMLLLQYVNEILKSLYSPSDHAMGFTEGRCVVDNASKHKGQNYVFNLDLKDFFPSIEQPRVWKRLQLKPFEFPETIASIIAGMCSMKETVTDAEGNDKVRYVLPQGAPTSPIITNMICDNLDRKLVGLAKRFGLNYSRYADDITFSSMHNVYRENGDFKKELHRIISEQGFTVNDKKTRLQKKGNRQEVTGIIVSDKLNVTQKYVREIRNLLYMWEKYGITVTMGKFVPKYKQEKGHVKKGNPDLINVLSGKLLYLKMVKGDSDAVYQRLHTKFEELVAKTLDPMRTTKNAVTYEETTSLQEFEKKNNTEVVITVSKPEGKSPMTESPRRYAYFILGNEKQMVSVKKSVTAEEEKKKEALSISLCRDGNNKQFWLIHRSDKATSHPVDIDELNNELDSLLNIQDG